MATGNAVLDCLPGSDRQRLLDASERTTLERKQVLFHPNEPIDHVYFVVRGVVSMVTMLENGGIIEQATIGPEGVVGVPMVLGSGTGKSTQIVCQFSGEALRMSADTFREEIERSHGLAKQVNNFQDALFQLVGQNVACNKAHTMQQRCAKWLLLTHDRIKKDIFELTHEFMAQMLGVRRASVTESAAKLQDQGLIRYRRGEIKILNRPDLEAESCECYAVISAIFSPSGA